ncbi:hypothetical protein PoB_005120200 [Plakobranchus ocellatus]|uniref:Uncharacterized protein n=1 Tax=Plakobranchus ocellatus TaxID=259542 RepID=A0AAV4C001_9GAST|nr:hypothetical protein PoB_005120200 [Plakobranchus ocellatus]
MVSFMKFKPGRQSLGLYTLKTLLSVGWMTTSAPTKYNILTIGSHVLAFVCALILNDSSKCFIFDSHSRNESGLCSPDGKATDSLGGVSQFEITPVIVKMIHVPSTESDSFDSDAILACDKSDFDSDTPFSTYAALMQQINTHRNERASKRKVCLMIQVLDESDKDFQDLGHITDSNATDDEEYRPPKLNRLKKK